MTAIVRSASACHIVDVEPLEALRASGELAPFAQVRRFTGEWAVVDRDAAGRICRVFCTDGDCRCDRERLEKIAVGYAFGHSAAYAGRGRAWSQAEVTP